MSNKYGKYIKGIMLIFIQNNTKLPHKYMINRSAIRLFFENMEKAKPRGGKEIPSNISRSINRFPGFQNEQSSS